MSVVYDVFNALAYYSYVFNSSNAYLSPDDILSKFI